MKNFCSAKTLVNGEINSKLEENICKPQATKNLSKIFKELLTFKNKQTYNLIKKKGTNILMDTSPKKMYRWQISL